VSLPYAKKQLGQHWLTDKTSLESMAEVAGVTSNDTVLEIGPGTGTLTEVLAAEAGSVIALEYDTQRAKELQGCYAGSDKVHVREGDVRSFDLSTLPHGYKIVANIPYYLTSNLLRKLVDDTNKPTVASLLVQKEVAERVAAAPGNYSQLAVFVQIFYEVSLGDLVPAYLFTPPPKVDSQILVLKLRSQPLVDMTPDFIKLVKAGFGEKRKKLRSSLSGGLRLQKSDIERALTFASLSLDSRAQELSIEQWQKLEKAIFPINT
jgi:16S rRNA (adenine1518-N6/adenine1519-N6)-dimethyltransferase